MVPIHHKRCATTSGSRQAPPFGSPFPPPRGSRGRPPHFRIGGTPPGGPPGCREGLPMGRHRRRLPSYRGNGKEDHNGCLSVQVGCLIPVSRSSSSGPFVLCREHGCLRSRFRRLAGSLHHSALWLRPPNVLGAIADGVRLATNLAGSPWPSSRLGTYYPLARNSLPSLSVTMPWRWPSWPLLFPATGTPLH